MDMSDLALALDRAGIRLTAEGSGIRAEPKGGLTAELREQIKAHRAAVLAGLSHPAMPEVRALLARHLGADHPDYWPAVQAAALSADPAVHLRGLRASTPPNCTDAERLALMGNADFRALVGVAR